MHTGKVAFIQNLNLHVEAMHALTIKLSVGLDVARTFTMLDMLQRGVEHRLAGLQIHRKPY